MLIWIKLFKNVQNAPSLGWKYDFDFDLNKTGVDTLKFKLKSACDYLTLTNDPVLISCWSHALFCANDFLLSYNPFPRISRYVMLNNTYHFQDEQYFDLFNLNALTYEWFNIYLHSLACYNVDVSMCLTIEGTIQNIL